MTEKSKKTIKFFPIDGSEPLEVTYRKAYPLPVQPVQPLQKLQPAPFYENKYVYKYKIENNELFDLIVVERICIETDPCCHEFEIAYYKKCLTENVPENESLNLKYYKRVKTNTFDDISIKDEFANIGIIFSDSLYEYYHKEGEEECE